MIVLSRKLSESVVIGDDITITVVDLRGDKVRLGIDHPRDVSVHRREIYEAIRRHAGPSEPGATSEPAAAERTTIALAESHVALLDRLRSTIEGRGATAPSREQALGAILDAFEAAQRSVAEATWLAHLEGGLGGGRRVAGDRAGGGRGRVS